MDETVFRSSLLGPVREPTVTVAIDVSSSMYLQLGTIQLGIRRWLETCCKSPFSPPKVNLVSLGAFASQWRSAVTQLTPENLDSVTDWLANLQCSGSACNLHEGLETVLSDASSKAVYLITDGCPQTDPVSANELLARVVKWNKMAQPIHIIVVSRHEDVSDEKKFSEMKDSWLGSVPRSPRQGGGGDDCAAGKHLLTSMALQTLGTIRHVTMPSLRHQVQVPHATVIANFHPTASPPRHIPCAIPTGRSTANSSLNGISYGSSRLGHSHLSNRAQTSPSTSLLDGSSLHPTSSEPLTPMSYKRFSGLANGYGLSLRPTESLLGRFVKADYMKGLQVLALKDDEGVYRMGRISEEVDADQFLIRFSRSVGGDVGDDYDDDDVDDDADTDPDSPPQLTHLRNFLALLDAMDQPVDVTDRVLALQRSHADANVYLPATVLKVLETTLGGLHDVTVMAAFHGGELEALPLHHVVKISASRYLQAVAALAGQRSLTTPPISHYEQHTAAAAAASHLPPEMHAGGSRTPAPNGRVNADSGPAAGPGMTSSAAVVTRLADDASSGPASAMSSATDLDGTGEASRSATHLESSSGGSPTLLHRHPDDTTRTRTGPASSSQWWTAQRNSPGRVLNVSEDYQNGFEAGFSAAQLALATTPGAKHLLSPGPEAILKSWYGKQEGKKSRAEQKQSSAWQNSSKAQQPRGGRSATLAAPHTPKVRAHSRNQPWTAPSQLTEDHAFDTFHRKKGIQPSQLESATDEWQDGARRTEARRDREQQRQQRTSSTDQTTELVKANHLRALREKELLRRKQFADTRDDNEKRQDRRGLAAVSRSGSTGVDEQDTHQGGQITARQLREKQRLQRLQDVEANSLQRQEEHLEARASRKAAHLVAEEQRELSAEQAAAARRVRLRTRAGARQSKDGASRGREDQRDDLQGYIAGNVTQDWTNRNFR